MGEHVWERKWTKGGTTVVECTTCRFRHQWPLPTRAELDKFYRDAYYQEASPTYLRDAEADKEFRDLVALDKLERFESFAPPGSPRRILDVGCSSGIFLEFFRNAGWEVYGVEPSKAAADAARKRGIPVLEVPIEEASADVLGGRFHAVHIREALDHFLDPAAVLRKIRRDLLLPNGVLAVENGNEFNDLQQAVVDHHKTDLWWITPDTISYFDVASLRGLLEAERYEVLAAEATFPLELFALLGRNYVGEPAVGRAYHLQRVAFEKAMRATGRVAVKRRLYEALASAGFGRSTVFWARGAP